MDDNREKDAAGSGGRGVDVHRDGQSDAGDALDLCVRAFHVRAVQDEGGKRSIRVVASTPAVDSYDEIVEQSWILDRFNANPVILWAHMSRELPLGYASDVGLVSGNLEMTINFVDEKANPKAPQVFESYKQGSMKAVSVGFYPSDVRLEMRDGREVYVLANNELIECSCTPIGANPEALAKAHQRVKAMALRAAPTNESPAAERGNATENNMTIEKAALDAAEKRAADAEAKIKDLEGKLAGAESMRTKLTGSLVDALIEAGRFAKDERDEQVELALSNQALFERLASKRTIRGAEIVNVKKLPDPPTGGVGAPHGDNAGADVDLLNEEGA